MAPKAIAILVPLILLELGSRVIAKNLDKFYFSFSTVISDPILHHVLIPSIDRTTGDTTGGSFPYTTNKQSWLEDYDVSIKKPANTYRIFYVGDSTTEGHEIPEKRMVEIVEKTLNEKFASSNIHFEVINTGTASYSFILYYLLIKHRLLEYSPDLIVIDVDMTDVVNDAYYRKLMVTDETGDILAVPPKTSERYIMTPQGYLKVNVIFYLPKWLVKHSDFFYLVDYLLRSFIIKRAVNKVRGSSNWLANNWSDEIAANTTVSLKILARTVNILRLNNAKVMITGVPNFLQYTKYCSERPHGILADFAKKARVPYLNSYEILKNKIKGTPLTRYYMSRDPSHFNEQGQRIWAEAQIAFLLDPKNNLLPFDKLVD